MVDLPHNTGNRLAHNVRLILLRRPTRLDDGSCTGNVNASKRNFAPSKIVKTNGPGNGSRKMKTLE